MSDQAGILPKWLSNRGILLAKWQLDHSYTFWTMPILIFSSVYLLIRHPLIGKGRKVWEQNSGKWKSSLPENLRALSILDDPNSISNPVATPFAVTPAQHLYCDHSGNIDADITFIFRLYQATKSQIKYECLFRNVVYFKFHEMRPKPATPISVMGSAMGLFMHYGFSKDCYKIGQWGKFWLL